MSQVSGDVHRLGGAVPPTVSEVDRVAAHADPVVRDMFRCHARRADLLGPPFTAEQVEDMEAGRRPSGRL